MDHHYLVAATRHQHDPGLELFAIFLDPLRKLAAIHLPYVVFLWQPFIQPLLDQTERSFRLWLPPCRGRLAFEVVPQPGNGTWRGFPSRHETADVFQGLAFITRTVIVRFPGRRLCTTRQPMLPRDIAGEVWRDHRPDQEKGENLPGYSGFPGCLRDSNTACSANATRPLHDDRRPTRHERGPTLLACRVEFREGPKNDRPLAEILLAPTLVPLPQPLFRTVPGRPCGWGHVRPEGRRHRRSRDRFPGLCSPAGFAAAHPAPGTHEAERCGLWPAACRDRPRL